jgi:benzil reductase ((S)-benzoin forming)
MNLYIVTGTTRGLGAALAERIARDAANELFAIARAAEGPIPGGFRFEADLTDMKAVERAWDRLERRLRGGGSHAKAVLINNAGVVTPVGVLDQVDAQELERNLAVNLAAPMLLMRRFLRATPQVALRRIINISSGAARRPIFGWSAYCAAKAGLDMASRCVALEAQARGWNVEVSSLAPGVIDTPMQGVVRGATVEQFADVERFRRMKAEGALRPADEVAADILRLEAGGGLGGDAVQDLRQRVE